MRSYSYELPKARIADWPAAKAGSRDSAKLLVVDGSSLRDSVFSELPGFLRTGDLLVLNNTAVVPSRFFAPRVEDDKEFEILLLRSLSPDSDLWEAMGRPLAKLRPGDVLQLAPELRAVAGERCADGKRIQLKLQSTSDEGLEDLLLDRGLMPIPPYIRGGRAEQSDRTFYQTVYSHVPGSIAAPTAGLHFTRELLVRLRDAGVEITEITHHVGAASFEAAESDPAYRPDAESYLIPSASAGLFERAKREGGRIVCVGTTGCRALESFARDANRRTDEYVSTDLFITPGHEFKLIDLLITNFHQPKSTHMHLVSAFAGADQIEAAYTHALKADYRFLSYGDAMLLAPGGLDA